MSTLTIQTLANAGRYIWNFGACILITDSNKKKINSKNADDKCFRVSFKHGVDDSSHI